jgi:hypothetical protein
MRRSLSLFALVLGVHAASPAAATVHQVPTDFPTIQAAIYASHVGDIVEIGPGTYLEHLIIGPAQDGATIRGTLGASATIVDAGGTGTVIVANTIGAATTLQGLTLRNGAGSYAGGGMQLQGASPAVVDCVIEGNSAQAAGGVYVDGWSNPTFTRCTIRNNHAPNGSGGGVYADHYGGGTFSYCLIYGNDCAAFGGGVTAWEYAHPVMDHCTITGNGAVMAGGNMFLTRRGGFAVTNSIVALPAQGANIEAQLGPGSADFGCSDLFAAAGANVVGLASPFGSGANFSADPLFCNAPVGDFGLFASSPCASANAGACHLVGAIDSQCGVVPTTKTSWGAIKTRYR